MNKKNGFTLIELLAAIVIIALLMIIAIPNIVKTMKVSRQSALRDYGIKMFDDAESKLEAERLDSIVLGDPYSSAFKSKNYNSNLGGIATPIPDGEIINSSSLVSKRFVDTLNADTGYVIPSKYSFAYAIAVSTLAPDQNKYKGCVLIMSEYNDLSNYDMVLFLYDGEYMLNGVMKKNIRTAEVVPDTIHPESDDAVINGITNTKPPAQ